MNAFLLFPDRDAELPGHLPPNHEALTQDLGLDGVFDAMALGDKFLLDVARSVVLRSLIDPETIRYRQEVFADCMAHPEVVRGLYDTVVDTIEGARKRRFGLYPGASPSTILRGAVDLLDLLVARLAQLRRIADRETAAFGSPGFTRFFAMLREELDDAYFQRIAEQLVYLKFSDGVVMSAQLGSGNKGIGYVIRRAPDRGGWWRRLVDRHALSESSFEVDPRDEAGTQTLAGIRGRAMNPVANALAQSGEHILGFFGVLRAELAFYVGCLNLRDRLSAKGEPMCVPTPLPAGSRALSARGLYDLSLTLHLDPRAVGNDLDADGSDLVVVTGANQGGKSTFLRSLGIAHLLMQCGMYVPAESFRADVRDGLFTHFKREEDRTMESGKLDEELRRISAIVDMIRPGSVLLCNESFGSTNEREGSEIARQVTQALVGFGVKVFFVTHLFDFAEALRHADEDGSVFLRAERTPDGGRTFRVVPGAPLPTSHGRDVFEKIFGPASAGP